MNITKEIKEEIKKLGKKTFPLGGIHPDPNKIAHNTQMEVFPLPDQAVVFMGQHLGAPATPIVQKGDKVKVGQLIGEAQTFMCANVHAPISGTVNRIDMVADFAGFKKPAIVIDREGDEWSEGIDTTPDIVRDIKMGKDEIIARMKSCGIVGLGGACFPTHIKYMLKPEQKCEYLIINAAECEPYICTDNRLILDHTEEIMIGIECALIASGAPKAVIGIENNKPEAIAALVEMAKKFTNIEVQPLKMKYPQGAEKQLIKAITGRSVPNGALPIATGCIVNNISTMYALYLAVQKNQPIVQTITTVSGKVLTADQCKIYQLRIGTKISDVLNTVGIPENTGKLISGGPMMGKAMSNLDGYVVKGMGSFLYMNDEEGKRGQMYPCIRCGRCVHACPMGLEPLMLYANTDLKRFEETEKLGIMNCIECGSCSFSCPANRPLVDIIRVGKAKTGAMIRARNAK